MQRFGHVSAKRTDLNHAERSQYGSSKSSFLDRYQEPFGELLGQQPVCRICCTLRRDDIASVQHDLGLEQQAIDSLQKVLELTPDQPGVMMSD
jgi:hypothetical protein